MGKLLIISVDATEAAAMTGFAQASSREFDVLVWKGDLAEVSETLGNIGAGKVFVADLPSLPPADYFANTLASFVSGYEWVAGLSSMQAKDGLARLSGKLDQAMVTDVLSIVDDRTFVRPMVAGSILATVSVESDQVFMTVRTNGFPAPDKKATGGFETLDLEFVGTSKRASETSRGGGRPDLSQANIVVSGGRPLKDAETFERVIGGLADALGGAVGATRAAVDSGIAANELQVGQTGKIVAPDLYIAAGISGSTQHMAGIKDSKVIVAVNTDGDAPIFDVADIGIVADLYEVIPQLTERLGKS